MSDQPSNPQTQAESRPRVVIAGGSGFIGRRLAAVLGGAGYDVVILTRGRVKPPVGPISFVSWQPASLESADAPSGAEEAEALAQLISGSHAVVNLCGESIGGPRWSEKRKALLVASRVAPTEALVRATNLAAEPPALLGVFLVVEVIVVDRPPARERWISRPLPVSSSRTEPSWQPT